MSLQKIKPLLQVGLFGLGKLAFLCVGILLYKTLSTENIGVYAVTYAIAIILATISECGLRGLLVRELARCMDSVETSKTILSGALKSRLLIVVPYFVIGSLVCLTWVHTDDWPILLFFLIAAWFDSNAFVFRGALRAHNYILLDAGIAGLSRILLLLTTGLLYWQHQLTLSSFSLVFAAIAFVDFSVTLSFIKAKTHIPLSISSSLRRTVSILKRGTPFIIFNIIGIIYIRVGVLMLGLSHTPESLNEAAAYNLSGRIPEGVSFLSIALMNASIPFFSRNSKHLERIIPVFKKLEFVLGCAGIILAVGLIFFTKEFILLLSKPEYLRYSTVFQIYAATIFFTYLQYVYANMLICLDQERRVAKRFGIVLLLNIALNFALVWKFQALGAVIALMLSEVASIAIDLRFLSASGINSGFKIVWQWIGIIIATVILALVCQKFTYPFGFGAYWIIGGACGAVLLIRTHLWDLINTKPDGAVTSAKA